MEMVSTVLSFIFRWVFFPAIYIGVFGILVYLAVKVAMKVEDTSLRRIVAGVLPFVILVFAVVLDKQMLSPVDTITEHNWLVFLGGSAVVEAARHLRRIDLEAVSVLYVFVLSTIACSLLYLTIFRLATPVHWTMLSFIVGVCLCIMVRGLPETDSSACATEKAGEGAASEGTEEQPD